MRLLQAHPDRSHRFSFTTRDDDDLPDYAILSHTWGGDSDEVIFEDVQNSTGLNKAGYAKLEFCAAQTARDGLEFFWIDTCCINKTASAELTEWVVRMFRWYADAKVCYVYLTDVDTKRKSSAVQEQFRQSSWFTRGWTLQELLAPQRVEFFSVDQERLGDKQSLAQEIHAVTDIPVAVLSGTTLFRFELHERLRWAQDRMTKRGEDQAYCLMGIFGVNMLPMYGEGKASAFRRLKQKLVKSLGEGSERPKTLLQMTNLSFGMMDSRCTAIATAYPNTCVWFIEHPNYVEWNKPNRLQEHHGLLWIGGKPGAGKSILMKYIHTRAAKSASPNEIVVSFFFNARGDNLERSTLGMWRALLFQLFRKAPDLLNGLKDIIFPVDDEPIVWNIASLCELFKMAVKGLGHRRLKCFIDAVDECDEDEAREMVHFFELLGSDAIASGRQLQICFASRHYSKINITYCQRVVLEKQTGHIRDITDYVQSRLSMPESMMLEKFKALIQSKANGVFIWVALVVNILNKEYARGRVPALKKKLEELPVKLSDLFCELLTRDTEDRADLVLSLQWILFASQPMTPQDFYYAMRANILPETSDSEDLDASTVTDDDIARFVVSTSKGLAEVTKTDTPTVQFIHESVREFLLKDNGLSELCPELGHDVVARSHERLKQICVDFLEFLAIANANRQAERTGFADGNTKPTKSHFLDYAFEAVLWHADQAAESIPQDQFLKDFPLSLWFELFPGVSGVPSPSLEYCLAVFNCHRLIRTLFPDRVATSACEVARESPLIAALANRCSDAVRAILNLSETHIIGELTEIDAAGIQTGQPMFLWIIENGYYAVASLVLSRLNPDVNETDDHGHTALSLAVRRGYGGLVGELLDAGAHTDAVDDRGLPPLLAASQYGFASIVAMLLVGGASVSAVDRHGSSALHLAVEAGAESVLYVLLQCELNCTLKNCPGKTGTLFRFHGRRGAITDRADIMARDNQGQTPLHLAIAKHRTEVASLLLQHGAGIEIKDAIGRTPLLLAAETSRKSTVEFLLNQRADCTACDIQGRTALHKAARRGSDDTVALLLEFGADLEAADAAGRTPLLAGAQGCDFWYRQLHYFVAICNPPMSSNREGDYLPRRVGIKVLQILLDWGADPSVVDLYGHRLGSYAVGRRILELDPPPSNENLHDWESDCLEAVSFLH